MATGGWGCKGGTHSNAADSFLVPPKGARLEYHPAGGFCHRPLTLAHHMTDELRVRDGTGAIGSGVSRANSVFDSGVIEAACETFISASLKCSGMFWAARVYASLVLRIGSWRIRLPVAAKMALQMAGAIGGTPGSPTPAGGASLGTM